MGAKVLVIIPCYNEEESISEVVSELVINYPQYDYCVINDGSTDDSLRVIKENKISNLNLCVNLGIGGAVQTGYKYAVEEGYEYAVQLDGDGQHNPKYISDMLDALKSENVDMIIGSRYIDKVGFQSSKMRRFGNNLINGIINSLYHVNCTDSTSGFRLCNRSLCELYANKYAEDYPEPEAIAEAIINGFKIAEIPVEMKERANGESSIGWLNSVYYMFKVITAILLQRIQGVK